jgi:hypothetical protein
MNPDYLRRDEIEYELKVRGINCDVDVRELRKVFRANISRSLSLCLEEVFSAPVEEILDGISSKISELQDLFEKSSATLQKVTSRITTRDLHLRGRLVHLTEAGLCVLDRDNNFTYACKASRAACRTQ